MEEVNSTGMRAFMPSDSSADDSATVVDSSADTGTVQEPSAQPVEVPQEAPEPTFATRFDPTKLSPELQQAYKQMQGDYTVKTQELANARKFHESYGKYEQLLGYIAKNPQFLEAYMQGGVPQEEEAVEEDMEFSDDPVEFASQIEERAYKRAMNEFMGFMEQQRQEQEYNEALNEDISQAESLDPRLDDNDPAFDADFSNMVADRVLADEGVSNGTKSFTQATLEAIAWADSYTARRLEAEKQKLSEMARMKRNPTASSSPTSTVAPETKPKTMREAAAEFL